MDKNDDYERAMKAYLECTAVIEFDDPSQPYPTREEINDRPMKILAGLDGPSSPAAEPSRPLPQ